MIKTNCKIGKGLIALLTFNFLFAISAVPALAVTQQDVTNALNEAQNARNQAKLKGNDLSTYNSQLNNYNSQISQINSALSSTNSQITNAQNKIAELSSKITDQENELELQKATSDKLISSWYMDGEDGLLSTLMSANTISEVTDQQQYYDSIRNQIETAIDNINAITKDLTTQKETQQTQLRLLTGLKNDQVSQQQDLQDQISQKSQLINNTKSAIASLNTQASAAEQRATVLRQQLEASYARLGGGRGSARPVIHGSSNGVPYYSQADPRWATVTMDPSRLMLQDYGCLITSFAMVASFFGKSVTPADVADSSKFDYDGNFQYFLSDMGAADYYEHRSSVNLNFIDSELAKGYPVIVGISLGGGSTHWIVLTGGSHDSGYSWNDPYPWSNPPTYSSGSFFAMRTYD